MISAKAGKIGFCSSGSTSPTSRARSPRSLRRPLVAEHVERGQHRLPGGIRHPGLVVEHAADGRFTDTDLARHFGETFRHAGIHTQFVADHANSLQLLSRVAYDDGMAKNGARPCCSPAIRDRPSSSPSSPAVLGFGLGYAPGRLVVLALARSCSASSRSGGRNDWLDAGARRRRAPHRTSPLPEGDVAVAVVRASAFVALAAAMVVHPRCSGRSARSSRTSSRSPAAGRTTSVSRTRRISCVPYAVSFGCSPRSRRSARSIPRSPAPWVLVAVRCSASPPTSRTCCPTSPTTLARASAGSRIGSGARAAGYSLSPALAVATVIITFGPGCRSDPLLIVGLVIGLA